MPAWEAPLLLPICRPMTFCPWRSCSSENPRRFCWAFLKEDRGQGEKGNREEEGEEESCCQGSLQTPCQDSVGGHYREQQARVMAPTAMLGEPFLQNLRCSPGFPASHLLAVRFPSLAGLSFPAPQPWPFASASSGPQEFCRSSSY